MKHLHLFPEENFPVASLLINKFSPAVNKFKVIAVIYSTKYLFLAVIFNSKIQNQLITIINFKGRNEEKSVDKLSLYWKPKYIE